MIRILRLISALLLALALILVAFAAIIAILMLVLQHPVEFFFVLVVVLAVTFLISVYNIKATAKVWDDNESALGSADAPRTFQQRRNSSGR